MKHHGRRPPKGSFPACPISGICRAQSVRTHTACKNCAVSSISLLSFLRKQGTNKELYEKITKHCNVCMDLLTRSIECLNESHDDPNFEKIVLLLYKIYGHGNVSQRYIAVTPAAPRPSDMAHARMILEELGLTCYPFNSNSEVCMYVEDLIYCKRHTPILSVNALTKICKKYERVRRNRKRKQGDINISRIKSLILQHEKQFKKDNPKFKEIPLRKKFNSWLENISDKHTNTNK